MRNRNLEAALAYSLKLGLPVFPVHGLRGKVCDCGNVDCHSPGKHPYTAQGLKDASNEEGIIREWWDRWPGANIGMPTGERSAMFVVDIDLPDGEKSFETLLELNGAVPVTPIQTTGSGGRQFFFAYPFEPVIRNSTGKHNQLGVNIDIRGEGGYVILPPSRHITGRAYKWGDDTKIGNLDVSDAPQWLVDLCAAAPAAEALNGNGNGRFQADEAIPEGRRNDQIYRLARALRAKRLSVEAVYQACRVENAAKCSPPLSDSEIRAIVDNAFKQPNRADFETQARTEEKVILEAGDPMEMARVWTKRTIDRDAGRIAHRWDGRFWNWNGAHYQMVYDEDMREPLWAFLKDETLLLNADAKPTKPSTRTVNEMLDALKSHINLNMLKHNPPCWIGGAPIAAPLPELVAVKNGILRISSGELYNPSPRFLSLTSIRTEYAPEAVPDEWVTFLNSMWPGEPEQIQTLQEMFGYLLTSAMDQQKMFMLIGPPRSGKGTIGQVLAGLLGEGVARPALSQLGDGFGKESLIGRQLAIISDARLDNGTSTSSLIEALLSISGQDNIDIERKHRQAWRGVLTTRFLFLTNELPRLWDASGALPNRFIVLATRVSHLGNEDRGLAARLLGELPGILNWAIDGWRRLQERGFFVQPSTVMELVDQFQTLTNPLGDFVNDDCELSEEHECRTPLQALYKSYLTWAEKQGQKYPLAMNVFARDLRAGWPNLRHERVGEKKTRWISGIKPKFEPTPEWEN